MQAIYQPATPRPTLEVGRGVILCGRRMQVGQRSVRVTIRDCHGLFAFGWVELLMGDRRSLRLSLLGP